MIFNVVYGIKAAINMIDVKNNWYEKFNVLLLNTPYL